MEIGKKIASSLARAANPPIIIRGSHCHQQGGLATGLWGLSLAFAELARDSGRIYDWAGFARRCVDSDSPPKGSGAFTGQDGKLLARAAGGSAWTPVSVDSTGSSVGDLIDGIAGRLWTMACLGSHDFVPPSCLGPSVLPADEPGFGMAHGQLGQLAARLAVGGGEFTEAMKSQLVRRVDFPGWCNGAAGCASASASAWLTTNNDFFGDQALRWSHEILRLLGNLAVDNLCHGSIGALVVVSAVGRLLQDEKLGRHAQTAARSLVLQSRRSGWRLDETDLANSSWLTGTGGICWGLLSILRQPLINPLVPGDAILPAAALSLDPSYGSR